MPCNLNYKIPVTNCGCDFSVNVIGLCDPSKIPFSKCGDPNYRTDYSWTEISIPNMYSLSYKKPDIKYIDQVVISAEITNTKLIETPLYLQVNNCDVPYYELNEDDFFIPIQNEEGTYLTGRKLIVEGVLKQKVIYTADLSIESVHSCTFTIPFSTFIVVYPKFSNANAGPNPPLGTVNVDGAIIDVSEKFTVDTCIEDVYIKALDPRTMFNNISLFLRAKPICCC